MLFYLNNVTGGGETVFPIADNRTYEEMVNEPCLHVTPGDSESFFGCFYSLWLQKGSGALGWCVLAFVARALEKPCYNLFPLSTGKKGQGFDSSALPA